MEMHFIRVSDSKNSKTFFSRNQLYFVFLPSVFCHNEIMTLSKTSQCQCCTRIGIVVA